MSYGEKMTTKNEHLSAVFDDEAGEFEQRRLLDEIEKDDELQNNWSRYALIGDVLREPIETQAADSSFLSGIQDKLDQEEEYSQVALLSSSGSATTWLRPASGFAVAAAVTAVSIFGVQSMIATDSGVGDISSNQPIAQVMQAQSLVSPPSIRRSTENMNIASASDGLSQESTEKMDQQTKMQRYLASHIRNASRRTIASTMRVVSYNY